VTTRLSVNGTAIETPAEPETPLLYILRNDLGLVGSRYGCGSGMCGACTVLMDGMPTTSCDLPIDAIRGREVTTIEGIAEQGGPNRLQRAFVDEQAGQCGYCLTGVIMTASALLAREPRPTRQQIGEALRGVLCRCGAQDRMIRAIQRAAGSME
jgi:nicotinate dehydrogenase subunit A